MVGISHRIWRWCRRLETQTDVRTTPAPRLQNCRGSATASLSREAVRPAGGQQEALFAQRGFRICREEKQKQKTTKQNNKTQSRRGTGEFLSIQVTRLRDTFSMCKHPMVKDCGGDSGPGAGGATTASRGWGVGGGVRATAAIHTNSHSNIKTTALGASRHGAGVHTSEYRSP